MFKKLFHPQSHKDARAFLTTSPIGTFSANLLDIIRTPGIDYVPGRALNRFGTSWIHQVVTATQTEPLLLPKTSVELRSVASDDHLILAVDTRRRFKVVGCIALWHLGLDSYGRDWFELGTLWVDEDYRFHGTRHMPIADGLYRRLLGANLDKNILATTANPAAIELGRRHGMQMISYQSLPISIHHATCVCPIAKTGTLDNMECKVKDQACRVRVPLATWRRLDKPRRTNWIHPKHNDTSHP